MSCPLGPAVQAPGVLRAWTAAPALPGRLMGTCRDLLRAGTGERKDSFEGKVVSEMSGGEAGRKDDPGGRNSPVNLLFRGSGRSWEGQPSSSPRPGPHSSRGGLQVVTVDVRNKKVVFKDGFKLEYSKLLLAPGSRWDGVPPCP